MKRLTTLFVGCLCAWGWLAAQTPKTDYEEMMDDVLQVRQKAGTEPLLRAYVQRVCPDADTVYALLFIPHDCPRCESTIQPFMRLVREMQPGREVVLIASYPDAEATRRYVARQGFGERYLVADSTEQWRQWLSLNTNDIYGMYVLAIDVKAGRLITGGTNKHITREFLRQVAALREPLPFHTYPESEPAPKATARLSGQADGALRYEDYDVQLGGAHVLSAFRGCPSAQDGRLVLCDNLENASFLFRLDEAARAYRLEQVLEVDSAVRDTFVDLPSDVYARNRSAFRYIDCSVNFFGRDEIVAPWSLPRVFVEYQDSVSRDLAFYNMPVGLRWGLDPFRSLPMLVHEDDASLAGYMDQHFTMFPIGRDGVAMACKRLTFPLTFTKEEYAGNPDMDPFMDEFYDRPRPYVAWMDKRTGHIVKRFGQLEEPMRRTRTGYGFLNLVADGDERTFVYGNGYAGLLYVTDASAPERILRTLRVFDLDYAQMPEPDTTKFYDRAYMQRYNDFFSQYVAQVKLSDDFIDCLVCHGVPFVSSPDEDVYEYVRFDRATGEEVERLALRPEDGAETVLGYGLERGGRPFYVGKRAGRTFVKFIERGA